MCGIFGVIAGNRTELTSSKVRKALDEIAGISIKRGNDSSGAVFWNTRNQRYDVIKGDIPVSDLLQRKEYRSCVSQAVRDFKNGDGFRAMGHARLVTNGSQRAPENNQPVVKDGIIGIHNGIIVNDESIWAAHSALRREYRIDTEVILSLLRFYLTETGDLVSAIQKASAELKGTFSCAFMFNDREETVLFTNNGSLYYLVYDGCFVFASESYFLTLLSGHMNWKNVAVKHLAANEGLVLEPQSMTIQGFHLEKHTNKYTSKAGPQKQVKITSLKGIHDRELVIDPLQYADRKADGLFSLLVTNNEAIRRLKRCSKCVLPETFPFIAFDSQGVCNYCRNYKPQSQDISPQALAELVKPFRRKDGKPDCIVPFSGGRDSTYSLHIIRNELGMNPITYTYDWGMVTDLARRNIARVCGKLGVENVIVAADIHKKRRFISANIRAWLKKPNLGMIPLFMAGDKSFHYHLKQLQDQTGISLNLWGENFLEKTDFKVGFAGVPPEFEKVNIYSLSKGNTARMLFFLGRSVLQNPAYLNASLFDNLLGMYSRNILKKKDYHNVFNYYPWDEEKVNKVIKDEYHWEGAIDTPSTWRVGDGTSAFYNYIYYTVAGFSEFDTFRSNQIREGMITREQAMKLIEVENQPRYETLKWYLGILNLDFATVIRRINSIEKLYER